MVRQYPFTLRTHHDLGGLRDQRSGKSYGTGCPLPPENGKRRPGGLTTPYPNPLFVLLLAMIVGGVWVTYGMVVYTLIRLKRGSTLA